MPATMTHRLDKAQNSDEMSAYSTKQPIRNVRYSVAIASNLKLASDARQLW